MIQRLAADFRTGTGLSGGVNLLDTPPVCLSAQSSVYTPGATLVDRVGLTPGLTQPNWSIVSVSASALIVAFSASDNPSVLAGLVGKLLLVLLPEAGWSTNGQGGNPYTTPALALPADVSLSSALFDGAQDSLSFNSTVGTPVAGSVSPPAPIPVRAGEQLSIGLWLTRSLVGPGRTDPTPCMDLIVINAQYTVTYDDGT